MENNPVSEAPGTSSASPPGHAPETLGAQVRAATGLNPARCYQCGKCSAGCPMAEEMELKTHEIIRQVQLGQRGKVLQGSSIWLCLTCETCTARCPNEFDPARLIDCLREIAARELPTVAPRRIRAFHRSFLEQIRSHGRVFEFGLVAAYKLRSGAFFDDVVSAPGMIARGKLKFTPQNIEGLDDVRRIFDACLAAEEE